MGKCKKRIFNKYKNADSINMKREEAVIIIVKLIKDNIYNKKVEDLISLFGISAEELAEAGAAYEELAALKGIL